MPIENYVTYTIRLNLDKPGPDASKRDRESYERQLALHERLQALKEHMDAEMPGTGAVGWRDVFLELFDNHMENQTEAPKSNRALREMLQSFGEWMLEEVEQIIDERGDVTFKRRSKRTDDEPTGDEPDGFMNNILDDFMNEGQR